MDKLRLILNVALMIISIIIGFVIFFEWTPEGDFEKSARGAAILFAAILAVAGLSNGIKAAFPKKLPPFFRTLDPTEKREAKMKKRTNLQERRGEIPAPPEQDPDFQKKGGSKPPEGSP